MATKSATEQVAAEGSATDPTESDELRAVEDGYREVSHELTPQEWSKRSPLHGLVDNLTRLTSAVQ